MRLTAVERVCMLALALISLFQLKSIDEPYDRLIWTCLCVGLGLMALATPTERRARSRK